MSDFTKIRPVVVKLFRVGRRTDMTKLLVAFCNFAKANDNRSTAGISLLTEGKRKQRWRILDNAGSHSG